MYIPRARHVHAAEYGISVGKGRGKLVPMKKDAKTSDGSKLGQFSIGIATQLCIKSNVES